MIETSTINLRSETSQIDVIARFISFVVVSKPTPSTAFALFDDTRATFDSLSYLFG